MNEIKEIFIPGIYAAISRTMADVGAVGKTETNEQQRYKYRGIDAIMNALNPAMIKNGIFVVPEVREHHQEERETAKGALLIYSIVKVSYKFYASDGSFVEAVTMGEGMDSGDKSTNKAMAAALKYACFQVFMIPTEELIDSEKDSPEPVPKEKKELKGISAAQIKFIGQLTTTPELEDARDRMLQSVNKTSIEELSSVQASVMIEKLKELKGWKQKEG